MKNKMLIQIICALTLLGCKKESDDPFDFNFQDLNGSILFEQREVPSGFYDEYFDRIWVSEANHQSEPKKLRFGSHKQVSNKGDRFSFFNSSPEDFSKTGWSTMAIAGNDLKWIHSISGTFKSNGESTVMAWSPDDSKLCLAVSPFLNGYNDTTNFLLIFDSENGEMLDSLEIHNLYQVSNLQWSKDGERIYFVASESNSLTYSNKANNIWSIKLSDKSLTNHTKGTSFENQAFSFDISPTGSMIVINSGTSQIAPFEKDEIKAPLYEFYGSPISPSWSPDGNFLVYELFGEIQITDKMARKHKFFREGKAPCW